MRNSLINHCCKILLITICVALLLPSCGREQKLQQGEDQAIQGNRPQPSESAPFSFEDSEKFLISTPEKVYATYYSESDMHYWELSQDEINDWVVWLNNLTVSPINLEESKTLIDYMYYNGNNPQYSFDAGTGDSLERIAYFGCGLEPGYLRVDNTWYSVDNPTEPFTKY